MDPIAQLGFQIWRIRKKHKVDAVSESEVNLICQLENRPQYIFIIICLYAL